ncbi:ROK family protein [Luedemannella helvata]|uniref:ROK family protein n=1 Tax=Luedemannella helvata TaxID=349315 RepID=A0ABP4W1W2_9ACTN
MTSPWAVAIDIGASKIAGALVDATGTMREHRVRPTPTNSAVDDLVWPELGGLIDDLRGVAPGPLVGVGIGSAGPLDLVAGTVSPVNIPAWRRFPLVDQVSRHARLPVRLAGDGICAAVGEHWLGAARGVDDVIVIVVSTGVGGGIIQRGRLHQGRSGNAGHVGHMVVDLDGDDCPCGGRGCVEAMSSGPSMVAWALRQGWRPGSPDVPPATVGDAAPPVVGPPGVSPSAVDLAAAARAGDVIARAAFGRAARSLAAGITSVAAAADLTHAVIGGGVAAAADLLLPPLRVAIAEYARLEFVRQLSVGVAELGGAAGLYGAAALIHDPARYGGAAVPASSGEQR